MDDSPKEDDNISPTVRALMAQFVCLPLCERTFNNGRNGNRLEKGSKSNLLDQEKEPTCTKIYYASRTHSQLSQILPEMMRLKLFSQSSLNASSSDMQRKRAAEDMECEEHVSYSRTVSLGSRKQLCINDALRSKTRDLDEGCRELLSG